MKAAPPAAATPVTDGMLAAPPRNAPGCTVERADGAGAMSACERTGARVATGALEVGVGTPFATAPDATPDVDFAEGVIAPARSAFAVGF